ncbi:MAG: hypothetical protein HY896_07010 [Deltaproteobacteria bacterium]|nr:hypothetical protein [Deltaproteobacteria bacterium]
MRRSAAWLLAAFFFAACGAKYLSVGSVPFPAPNPVFLDERGEPRANLPESSEPLRLIFLDYVWCPPCADVWKSLKVASRDIPAGSVRVYRILFDRERLLGREGTKEVAPLRPSAQPDAGTIPVTTLLALPGPFKARYGPEQAPLLLLADADGKVLKKWTGASPSLAGSIVSEIKSLSSSPLLPEM